LHYNGSGEPSPSNTFYDFSLSFGEFLLQKIYSDAPPLHGILAHLIPNSKATPGKFAIHEGTDYVDLGFYVTILGVAVSNIKTYVSQERDIKVSESLSKGGERGKSLLQLLHGALETLHSNIGKIIKSMSFLLTNPFK